jgi:hypothetical protein
LPKLDESFVSTVFASEPGDIDRTIQAGFLGSSPIQAGFDSPAGILQG